MSNHFDHINSNTSSPFKSLSNKLGLVSELSPSSSKPTINSFDPIEQYHKSTVNTLNSLNNIGNLSSAININNSSNNSGVGSGSNSSTPTLYDGQDGLKSNQNNANISFNKKSSILNTHDQMDIQYNQDGNSNNSNSKQQQSLPSLHSIEWFTSNNGSSNSSMTNSPTNLNQQQQSSHQNHNNNHSNSSQQHMIYNKEKLIEAMPSSPEFINDPKYERIMANTLDTIGKMESIQKKYEIQIEQLMNQTQASMEREKKQRVQYKTIEDAYSLLESENTQLKRDLLDLNKRLKEIERVNELNLQNQNTPTKSNSLPPLQQQQSTSNNLLLNKFSQPLLNEKRELIQTKPKKKGDEELVAEALGSFVEFTSRSKPVLKRSNSEDSFMHSLPTSGNNSNIPFGLASSTGIQRDESSMTIEEFSSGNNSNTPITLTTTTTTATPKQHKKRKSESYGRDEMKKKSLSTTNVHSLVNNSNSNPLSTSGTVIKMETSATPKQQKNKQQNAMDTDLDASIELENIDTLKSSTGIKRDSSHGSESPDENSRNQSSSPIEAPLSEAMLFKSIATSDDTPHEAMLNEIHRLQMAQKDQLEKMHQNQKQILQEHQQVVAGHHAPSLKWEELVTALQIEQKKLYTQLESELNALGQLYSSTILEPSQLCKLDILIQDVSIQLKQLQLYQLELSKSTMNQQQQQNNQQNIEGGFPAALVITKQPFPMVISKFKQLQEDHLTVQLLVGSNVDIVSFSPIRAELIFHTKATTKGNGLAAVATATTTASSAPNNAHLKKHIEKDTQTLDPVKGTAKFPIKFLTGTRKGCVKLHFVLSIRTSDGRLLNVPSNTSQPFIVITNDCQWEGSEGTLLKKESFNEQYEVTWQHFVNILQKHFLKATKQSPIQPTRPLSHYDFNYLSSTFFGTRANVNHKDFDNFWTWFGKSLQTLRYKRHISTLWQNGLIFMFLKRELVNNILKGQEPGTFLILFSESCPGQLEISYVALLDPNQQSTTTNPLSNSSSISPPPSANQNSSSSSTPSTTNENNQTTTTTTNTVDNQNNNNNESTTTNTNNNSNTNTTTTENPLSTSTLILPPSSSNALPTKIKHYLVQPNDTSGSKRTLPDFLNECPQFSHILQLNVPMLANFDVNAIPPFKREPKNQILEPYYSKRQNSTNFLGVGYDPLN